MIGTSRQWRVGLAAVAAAAALAVGMLGAGEARGAGLLIPKDEKVPPLAVKYLRVDATIENQAATTRVVQEFQNSTDRDLECTYIFPLPKGAAIRDFAMYIGGKRMKGELLERDKARAIYEEIVRRTRDPGLLEYMDGDLLRMRIFPVPARGTQKVELEYSELVRMDDGLAEYVFPLRTGERSARTLEDFTVAVRIRSAVPLKNVYSPTHEIGVSRPSDREAVAGMEQKAAALDRDFQLFYTVSEKDFGLHLMTHRPEPGKPGMFLMLLAPKTDLEAGERVPRDLVLVVDTSGSMKGEKIEQARRALAWCVDHLDPRDRVALVRFSTSAEAMAEGWTEATDEGRGRARAWIERLEAGGGTNIAEALQKTFALAYDERRPATILFLTDGRPTVDVTDIETLARRVQEGNKRGLRIFTFGVGDDVNTHLLDRMCNVTGGLPEYVRPGEAIDAKMTRLYAKLSHPVLTDLALEVPGVKIIEMYPKSLPDLFRGSQVVVVGAYEGSGDSVIRLKGRAGERTVARDYEGTFPEKTAERSFIAPLYAQRKIGYLLDQIRLHGENAELREEVIRLSLAYGIETPYTSYLVLESAEQYKQYGIARHRTTEEVAPTARPALAKAAERQADRLEGTFAFRAPSPAAPADSLSAAPAPAGVRAEMRELREAEAGEKAVTIAQDIQRLRQAEQSARGRQAVQRRAGQTFANYRGVWVDERFQGTERLVKVKWGSEAFFRLSRERAEWREMLSQGQRVVFVTAAGQAVAVDTEEGVEALSDAEIRALLTAAPAAP